jgi:uncharacterized protein with HEPN domain
MTPSKDGTRLLHMLDYAREAVRLAQARSRQELDTDRVFNLAMTRLLEIVGEATARVSQPTRDRHPQIPWSAIAGMRNRLIHGYDAVDFDILWDVVQRDLPGLIVELEKMVPSAGREAEGS